MTTPRLIGSTPTMVSAPAAAGHCGDLGRARLQRAQIGRVLEIHRRHVRPELGPQVGHVEPPGRRVGGDQIHRDVAGHLGGLAIGADDRQTLGVAEARAPAPRAAPGDPRRHADRVADGAAPGIDRQLHHIEVQQRAQLAVELEPRLIAPVVGLVACPRRWSRTRSAPRSRPPRRAHGAARRPRQGSSGSSSQLAFLRSFVTRSRFSSISEFSAGGRFSGVLRKWSAGIWAKTSATDCGADLGQHRPEHLPGAEFAIHGWARVSRCHVSLPCQRFL